MKRFALLLLATASLVRSAQAPAQTPATTLATLASPSIGERRAAAEALLSLGTPSSDDTEAIARELYTLRHSDDGPVYDLVKELRVQGGKDGDLVELLVKRNPSPVTARALATVCLMRALVRIGTTQAVRSLVLEALDAEGAFRPELLEEVKELDDRATAALIEVRGGSFPEMRVWAKDALEALGRRAPGDTVQTTNDQVLMDVLHAYAVIRDPDALPVVLSFVNSDRAQVRNAAREATLAYGQDALGKLRSTYAALTGERLPDSESAATPESAGGPSLIDAADVAHKLFNAYDHSRMRDVYARFDEGLAKQRAGDTEGAIAAFDEVLARQPLLDRRAEIVPAYVAYAEALEPSDRVRATDYLQRALRLDDRGGHSNHVRSELLYLEGDDLMTRGIADTGPFVEALALDPQNAHARDRLDRLRASAELRWEREGHIASGVGATGVVLITIGLVALLMRKRHRDDEMA